MKIDSLQSVSIETLTQAISIAFKGYFVQMPDDPKYWDGRFTAARVDYNLSQGVFNKDKLIGFVVNAVDEHEDELTAHNTGTGVVPEFRGRRLVDQIYEHSIPILKEEGIKKCSLEVIVENDRAIKVYKRIGFEITKTLKFYAGELPGFSNSSIGLKEFPLSKIDKESDGLYSWDFRKTTILKLQNKYRAFNVVDTEINILGSFVINEENGTVA